MTVAGKEPGTVDTVRRGCSLERLDISCSLPYSPQSDWPSSRGCAIWAVLCPYDSRSLSNALLQGDECGLCKWDPGDEYDAHGRARLHAVYPHRVRSACLQWGDECWTEIWNPECWVLCPQKSPNWEVFCFLGSGLKHPYHAFGMWRRISSEVREGHRLHWSGCPAAAEADRGI